MMDKVIMDKQPVLDGDRASNESSGGRPDGNRLTRTAGRIARPGLRTRLTLMVTVVFGIALTIASVVGMRAVSAELVRDARANAEQVLTAYLAEVYGGVAAVGVVDDTSSTHFFYRDANGRELSPDEFFGALSSSGTTSTEIISSSEVMSSASGVAIPEGVLAGGPACDDLNIVEVILLEMDPGAPASVGSGGPVEIFVDEGGELFDSSCMPVELPQVWTPLASPKEVDRGDGVVAVAQPLGNSEGTTFEVGVSSPLRPVTDSIQTLQRLLWFVVPALVLLVAAITWITVGRTLAPVHAISSRTRSIEATNLTERVPVGRADDEIGELAVTMNSMLDRLQAAQDRQRQLVSDASHELRSPVAASRAQLEVAAANPSTADWTATAYMVLAEQEHLAAMIDDLLSLSRLDEARSIDRTDVDLDDIVLEQTQRVFSVAVSAVFTEPVRVGGDRALLTRVVRNLVDNAARHADAEVVVILRSVDGQAVIDVDDDGPGIPESERSNVFNRFTRLDEARSAGGGGAGLGLAIVKETVVAHGGTVAVTESPLGGARFRVTLPKATTVSTGGDETTP